MIHGKTHHKIDLGETYPDRFALQNLLGKKVMSYSFHFN